MGNIYIYIYIYIYKYIYIIMWILQSLYIRQYFINIFIQRNQFLELYISCTYSPTYCVVVFFYLKPRWGLDPRILILRTTLCLTVHLIHKPLQSSIYKYHVRVTLLTGEQSRTFTHGWQSLAKTLDFTPVVHVVHCCSLTL